MNTTFETPEDAPAANSASPNQESKQENTMLVVFQSEALTRQAIQALPSKSNQKIVCVRASELNDSSATSLLTLSANTTLTFIVRAMIHHGSLSAFGAEGQYGVALANLAKSHAAFAGRDKVMAIVVAPSDGERIVPQGESTETYVNRWKTKGKWPYEAVAVFVPTLRRLSETEVVAALQALPKITFLSDC